MNPFMTRLERDGYAYKPEMIHVRRAPGSLKRHRPGSGIHITHWVMKPDGEIIEAPFAKNVFMAKEEFFEWVSLGCPMDPQEWGWTRFTETRLRLIRSWRERWGDGSPIALRTMARLSKRTR